MKINKKDKVQKLHIDPLVFRFKKTCLNYARHNNTLFHNGRRPHTIFSKNQICKKKKKKKENVF